MMDHGSISDGARESNTQELELKTQLEMQPLWSTEQVMYPSLVSLGI